MKDILIKNATIIDKQSNYHLQKADILISSGIISKISQNVEILNHPTEIIEGENLFVSHGWMDLRVNFNDPGFEYKEDLQSGSEAALKGGFTAVACMGTTQPALHNKAQIEYIINKSKSLPIEVYPIGTVTLNAQGIDMSEMYDMACCGAIAFSDNKNPIDNADLLQRALLYTSGFNKKIIQIPSDKTIAAKGQINEGKMSTMLGLKGIPAIAEELMLQRDLTLVEHHQTSIHFGGISTAKSVALIREAKKKGLPVSCDVHAVNLLFDDSALGEFDTNYKVKPPLRSQKDIEALKQGLLDGTIDVICSDHTPEDTENKVKEFNIASFGMTGLETFYGVVKSALGTLMSEEQLIEKIMINPRQIFGLNVPQISEGQKANITVFDPEATWSFQVEQSLSKSQNTPFNQYCFKGKVIKTILTK